MNDSIVDNQDKIFLKIHINSRLFDFPIKICQFTKRSTKSQKKKKNYGLFTKKFLSLKELRGSILVILGS